MDSDTFKPHLNEEDPLLTPEEWAELDADHQAYLRGEGPVYTWEEVKEQLRKDQGSRN